jgi:hypothetical protein
MSLYTSAIANGAMGYVGADAQSVAELAAANAKLQTDIKAAVKAFPAQFTRAQAAKLLWASVRWGQAAQKAHGSNDALKRAIAAADAMAYQHDKRAKAGDTYVYRKGANREWADTQKAYILPYIEAGGRIGEGVTQREAVRELKQDLQKAAENTFKWGGGVVLAAGATAAMLLFWKGKRA